MIYHDVAVIHVPTTLTATSFFLPHLSSTNWNGLLQEVAGATTKMGKPEEVGEEDDDDPGPIDTKPECEATCKPRCVKQLLAYEACEKRVAGIAGKHCTGQYFDYWGCIDKCAATKIFRTLK